MRLVPPSYYQIFRIAPTKKRPEIIVMERTIEGPGERILDSKKKETVKAIDSFQQEVVKAQERLSERHHP